jgi:sugar/nucleoside kinase (ribokinase family)
LYIQADLIPMTKIAVIGHIAIDKVIDETGQRVQLGGPPPYIALSFGILGDRIHAVSKIGDDISKNFLGQLRDLGVNAGNMIVDGAETTRFILDYTQENRVLGVESVCEKIGSDDIDDLPDAALITPIIGELTESAVEAIQSDVLALDPQGFLRRPLDDGSIQLQPWRDRELLGKLDVLKASADEVALMTGESDPRRGIEKIRRFGASVAVTTLGQKGSLVAFGGRLSQVPAYDSDVRDSTGAGDVFLGSFMSEYLRGEDPVWCACVGSAVASLVVETFGARIDSSKRDVFRRAEELLDRVVRV